MQIASSLWRGDLKLIGTIRLFNMKFSGDAFFSLHWRSASMHVYVYVFFHNRTQIVSSLCRGDLKLIGIRLFWGCIFSFLHRRSASMQRGAKRCNLARNTIFSLGPMMRKYFCSDQWCARFAVVNHADASIFSDLSFRQVNSALYIFFSFTTCLQTQALITCCIQL